MKPSRALSYYTRFVAASTLFLIFAGAMVTSTGSGLAVPDWPLSYGMLFPPMVGGIFYEHGHRMVAATVGLLTVIQAIWLQRREPRRFLRRLGWISVLAVIAQGLLGGLTVIFLLPPAISISHAALAEVFLCLNVAIAFFVSRPASSVQRPASKLVNASTFLVAAVYLQILVGALMRHLQAGMAIPDFPLSFGKIIPNFTSTAIAVNYGHRLGGLLVTILVFALAPTVWRSGIAAARYVYGAITVAVLVQIALGAMTVWTAKAPVITSLHVVTGASILALSLLLALVVRSPLPVVQRMENEERPTTMRDLLELAKARIVLMVLVTTAAGFALAPPALDIALLVHTLIGTALIAAGTNALNQYMERDLDKQMERTRRRPLPDGRLSEAAALIFSIAISVAGAVWLDLFVNWIASALAVITLMSYLFIYTPLKTRTSLCTVIGAAPGAIPPMIGWAAATGSIDAGAWILFGILFLWQLPHFLAIGWLYRDDYARAGFSILSVTDASGSGSGRQAMLYALALLPVSVLPSLLGIAGPVYFAVGLVAGLLLIGSTMQFARTRSRVAARKLFITSNVYLVFVMTTLVTSNAVGSI